MSVISGQFLENRLILPCKIATSGSVKDLRDPNSSTKYIDALNCTGLIDTGATCSCVNDRVITSLKLKSYSLTQMTTASGVVPTEEYQVDILISFEESNVPIESVSVCRFHSETEDLIIGMDIILRGHLSISKKGLFAFSL